MSRSTISTFQLFEKYPNVESARIYLVRPLRGHRNTRIQSQCALSVCDAAYIHPRITRRFIVAWTVWISCGASALDILQSRSLRGRRVGEGYNPAIMSHYIVAKCPHCEKEVQVAMSPTSHPHLPPGVLSVTCPSCGKEFRVPSSDLQVLTTNPGEPPLGE